MTKKALLKKQPLQLVTGSKFQDVKVFYKTTQLNKRQPN